MIEVRDDRGPEDVEIRCALKVVKDEVQRRNILQDKVAKVTRPRVDWRWCRVFGGARPNGRHRLFTATNQLIRLW
jgi:hypothetical protein